MSHTNQLISNTQIKPQVVFSPSPRINDASRLQSNPTSAQTGQWGLLAAGSQVTNLPWLPNSSVNHASISPLGRSHPVTTPPSMGFNFAQSETSRFTPIGPAGFPQQPGATTFSLTQSWPNGPRMPSSFTPAGNPYHTPQTIVRNFPNPLPYSDLPSVVPTPTIYGQPPYLTANTHAVITNTYNALGINRDMSVHGLPSLQLKQEITQNFHGKQESQMVLKNTEISTNASEEMRSGKWVKDESRMVAVKEDSGMGFKDGATGVKEESGKVERATVIAINKRKASIDQSGTNLDPSGINLDQSGTNLNPSGTNLNPSGTGMKKMKSIRVSNHHRTTLAGNISSMECTEKKKQFVNVSQILMDSNHEIEFPTNNVFLTSSKTSNHDITGDSDAYSNLQTSSQASSPPEETASFKQSHLDDLSCLSFPHTSESSPVSLGQDLDFSFLNSPHKIILESEISSEMSISEYPTTPIDAPLPMTSETNSVDFQSHEDHTSCHCPLGTCPFGTSDSSFTFSSSSSSSSTISSEDEVIHHGNSNVLDDSGLTDKERKELKLKLAMSAVNEGKLDVPKAVERFGVPETTLRRRLKNPTNENPGRKHLLTKEEEASVVDATLFMGEMGLGFTRQNLHWIVDQVLKGKGEKGKASRSWMDRFIARYRHLLVMRTPEIYSKNRAVAGNQEDHDLLFNQLQNIYDLRGYHNRPEAILNFDEKPHGSNVGQEKILMAKGTKDGKRLSNDNTKMKTSVLHTCVANGSMLPPVIIYRAKNVMRAWTEGGPEGALYAANDTGNMTKELCLQYFEQVLVPYRNKVGDRILVYADGFRGHLSYEIIKLCIKWGIDLWIWPSHTSDTYQMCDKGLFGPAQSYWVRTIIPEHLHSSGFSNITKVDIPPLLAKLYSSPVFSKKNVVNSFRGFYPLDRDFVKQEVLSKTQVFHNVPIIPKEVDIFVNPNRLLVDPVTGVLTSENTNESGDAEPENTSFSRNMICSNINEILRNLLQNEQESVCVPWALPWDLLDLLTVWSYHMEKSESLKEVLNLSDLTKFRTIANAFQKITKHDNEDGLIILALDLFKTLQKKVDSNLKNTLTSNIHILEETLKSRGIEDGAWHSEDNTAQTVDGLEEDCDQSMEVPVNNVQIRDENSENASLTSDGSPSNVLSLTGHPDNITEQTVKSPLSDKLSDQSKEKKNSHPPQSVVEEMGSESFMKNVYGSNLLEDLRKLSQDPSKESSDSPSRTSPAHDEELEQMNSPIRMEPDLDSVKLCEESSDSPSRTSPADDEELEQMNSPIRTELDLDSVKLCEVRDGSNSQNATPSRLTPGRERMDQTSTNYNSGLDRAAYKEGSGNGEIQMVNFVRCPCQLKVIDSGMLFCKQCGTLQHNICFRIVNGQVIESHACLDCSERHDIKCTDYNLREVGDKELIRMTCLFRRVVNALSELSTVTLEILAHGSKVDDKEVLETFWRRLLNAGAIRHDSFGEHFIVDKNVLQSKLTPQTFGFGFSRKRGIVPEAADNSVDETVSISSSRGTVEIPSVKKALLETIQKQFQRAPTRKPVGKKMLFKTEGNFLATSEMIDNRFTQQEEKEKEEKAAKVKKKEASLINKKAKELEKEQKMYEKKKRIEEKEREKRAKEEEKEREKRAKEEEKAKKLEEKKKKMGGKQAGKNPRKKRCTRVKNTTK